MAVVAASPSAVDADPTVQREVLVQIGDPSSPSGDPYAILGPALADWFETLMDFEAKVTARVADDDRFARRLRYFIKGYRHDWTPFWRLNAVW
jgi:hypothetical protein